MPDIKVTGIPAFEAKLNELEFSMQRKALIEVAKAGAQIVVDAATIAAPKDTGAMAASIGARVASSESTIFEAVVQVSPSKKAFYWRFIEGGTKERFYKHGRKGSSGFITARPFLRPALESNRERIVAVMKEKMAAIVNKVGAKWRKA